MTFDEALALKQSFKSEIYTNAKGLEMKILVTPAKKSDFEKYLADVKGNLKYIKDSHAARFSNNAKFKVMGIWTDKVNSVCESIDQDSFA